MIRRLLVAFAFWMGLVSPIFAQSSAAGPPNSILCNQIASLAIGNTTSTKVVSGVTGKTINICGWHVTNTGATGTFTYTYGTGSNCGTGTTTIVPASNVTSTAPDVDHIDFAIFSVPAGNDVCITTSVATVASLLYFSQF